MLRPDAGTKASGLDWVLDSPASGAFSLKTSPDPCKSFQNNWGQVQELKADQKLYLKSYCKQLVERTCTVKQWNEVRALLQDPQCTAPRMRKGNRGFVSSKLQRALAMMASTAISSN